MCLAFSERVNGALNSPSTDMPAENVKLGEHLSAGISKVIMNVVCESADIKFSSLTCKTSQYLHDFHLQGSA